MHPAPRKPNTLKQKNGFPPNFIHSLDSSHMMLTALHCYRCTRAGDAAVGAARWGWGQARTEAVGVWGTWCPRGDRPRGREGLGCG